MATPINATILELVSSVLEGAPDPSIPRKVWQEIVRLQSALKELATIIDLINATPTTSSEFQVVGSAEVAIYLGQLTTVDVIPGESIDAGVAVRFLPTGSGIRAYRCADGPADAITLTAVSAGVESEFILKGLFVYPRQVASPSAYIVGGTNHQRLATLTLIAGTDGKYWDNYDNISYSAFTSAGLGYQSIIPLCWNGPASNKYANNWQSGYWFVGTSIGYVGTPSSLTSSFAYNALVYFNPRRT